jgi:hypothetical protein
MQDQLQHLVEKDRIIDTINQLFISTDTRDWPTVRACFADKPPSRQLPSQPRGCAGDGLLLWHRLPLPADAVRTEHPRVRGQLRSPSTARRGPLAD